jgi:hypothetical protein
VVGTGGAAEALEVELGLLLALGLLELQPRLVTGCVAELAEGQDLLRLFLGLLPALRAEGRIDFPADLGRPLLGVLPAREQNSGTARNVIFIRLRGCMTPPQTLRLSNHFLSESGWFSRSIYGKEQGLA